MIDQFNRIVVLTGAGISAESGVATFRGSDGLWHGHKIEEVATPEAFAANPDLVQAFYNARRQQLLEDVDPNPAHHHLAEFEQQFSGDFLLVTQNVDNLHDRAGSKNLLHMHGELTKARHVHHGEVVDCHKDLEGTEWRPHIVWFGEMPFYMDQIYAALEACDLFVSIGTSGQVYPAAGFVDVAKSRGAHAVQINIESAHDFSMFDEHLVGPATEIVPEFFRL